MKANILLEAAEPSDMVCSGTSDVLMYARWWRLARLASRRPFLPMRVDV